MNWAIKSMSVILAAFFIGGIILCVGMATSAHHSMTEGQSCPMTNSAGGCQAPADHLSYWSHILSVTLSDFAGLILALIAASTCLWLVSRGIWNPHNLISRSSQNTLLRFSFIPRHALQEAFSNGILNPKLY